MLCIHETVADVIARFDGDEVHISDVEFAADVSFMDFSNDVLDPAVVADDVDGHAQTADLVRDTSVRHDLLGLRAVLAGFPHGHSDGKIHHAFHECGQALSTHDRTDQRRHSTHESTIRIPCKASCIGANETPLLSRGGVDATLRKGGEASLLERTGWCWSRNPGQHHPVCAIWWLRNFFLIAQPPLLGWACCPAISGDHNFRTNGFVAQLKSRMPDSAMSAMGRG